MANSILKQGYGFAVYPSVKLMGYKTNPKTKKKSFGFIKQLLFGDYIKPVIENNKFVELKEKSKTYIKVRSRNTDGYILPKDIQAERILEVNFIDVGQGDGVHIVTPDDKHFLIDAGATDNMFRFLKWRFNLKKSKVSPPKFTAVITHSDKDHYYGFTKLFVNDEPLNYNIKFDKILHNGLIEASGSKVDSLGKVTNDGKFITELIDTDAQFKKRAKELKTPGMYIEMLKKTEAPKQAIRFTQPITSIYKSKNMRMDVISPVSQKINKKDSLPVFASNKGKTKNGNSVVLKLTIGNLKVILGGDLNSEAEDYLLSQYSKVDIVELKKKLKSGKINKVEKAKLEKTLSDAIESANNILGADIAKSCHHGSSDFTSEFLKAINPVATIISSGDEEPHCHPRPDTLGTIGKYSRGERSLIFSTELARSSKEFINVTKLPASKKIRTVTVYGMINVRSDGNKVIIAQKLEKPAASRNWDIHKLEWNDNTKQFEYVQFLEKED